ncbi:hypothetical protein BAUCODRAFT_157997 [Baudoinia panamericana UAMH 10762]|uniref:NTF2-like domain-containing protein n=1 Tax=Baudoinia panamericana (strain UAMH 10762) TaxID=717646 RepID=M2N5R8_BAUPA|nr:uncharacterized protein BAUCODRAFT_157997 [Baudoinia panamericana UAMH 10762]EMC94384.1 hypothetical protein BAUCODRAFT_157997 [Baudoinia panamericana UAMH 10762]
MNFLLITTCAFIATTSAQSTDCISQNLAVDVVAALEATLTHVGNVTQIGNALLADDFVEISDSILSLQSLPLGGVSAPSKQAWIEGISHSPADTNITTLDIGVVCPNKILWQWQFNAVGRAPYPVKGFNYIVMDDCPQIQTMYIEFNSIAWALDDGELNSSATA